MSNMLIKNTLHDISKTKARFISIMLIILLGVGFLVGINSTAPSMFATAGKYYDETNLMDFRLLSTVGFSNEDVKAISMVEGVDDVMPSYFTDVILTGDTGSVIRLYSVPEKYGECDVVNELTLKSGRMPESSDEILVGSSRFGEEDIGTKISFASAYENAELSETLKYEEYIIVGVVDSPLYISFERGSTNVGSGKIADYMFVLSESFSSERYTELYVTASQLRGPDPYSDEYSRLCEEFKKTLENAGQLRIESFIEEEIKPAQSSIDEASVLLSEKKTKAQKELESAQASLDEAEVTFAEEVENAESTLADAKKKIDNAKLELENKKTEFNESVALVQQETDKAKEKIDEGKKQLQEAKIQLKEGLFEKVNSIGITREQFDTFFGDKEMLTEENVEDISSFAEMYKPGMSAQMVSLQTSISQMEAEFEASGKDPQTSEEYQSAKEKYAELSAVVTAIEEFADSGKDELLQSIKAINSAEQELIDSEEELNNQQEKLSLVISEAKAQFDAAEAELGNAEAEYESGVAELQSMKESTRAELDSAQAELDSNKETAEKEFADAQEEIDNAQNSLDSIPQPAWIYNDRTFNPGYGTYDDNVGRLTAVGKVFPVFFLLVAVLVCVTTMSRLVEEQRGDIGALTTLGYKKYQIFGKYAAYATGATIVGAAVGIFLGLLVLPAVIFNAYRMLYSSIPDLVLRLDVKAAVVATCVAIVCTNSVSFFTCNALLKKKPATLLRPKAPKPGKRILLERVKFLWKRLGFFSKVTVRNIFRYKARFFMTVIGVAGCTALIVAAMGLHRSINDVVSLQFGEIFTNDAVVALENPSKDNSVIDKKITTDERFSAVALCRQNLAQVMTGYGHFDDDTYIVVPKSVEEYEEIVHLRERKSSDKIHFGSEGVILSEKLAKELKVSVGDEVRVVDKEIKKAFNVDAICENYMYGYVFMSPEVYRDNFGTEPEYNMYLCKYSQDMKSTEDALGEEYLKEDGVLGISFMGASIQSFEDMIGSLNYVVLVMVVCAAALAIVVLYNLTNINIAERKREISTLKVLGFKNSETSAYIYRENILLTLVGIAIGLVLGVALLRFVIVTVEIDMVMFGRKLYAGTFIIAAVLTALFATIVNLIMHLRIKKIDMVESLKSIE